MISFINLKGYMSLDPVDKANGFLKYFPLMLVNLFLSVGWLYAITKTNICHFNGVNIFNWHFSALVEMGAEVLINVFIFSPLIVLFRKSSSLIPFLIIFIPWIILELYTQSHFRCATCQLNDALWFYPDPSPISFIHSPLLKGFLAMSADGLVFGVIALYLARLLASVLFAKKKYSTKPSWAQYKALFNDEWSDEKVPQPRRDWVFWILRLLGFIYLCYLVILLLGILGTDPWPESVRQLIEMTYRNPALAINTYFKISLMISLAFVGAYNKDLRYYSSAALLIGHGVSTVYSLIFHFCTGLNASDSDFLLLSAEADGVMMIFFVLIMFKSRKDSRALHYDKDFPINFSVPLTLIRYQYQILCSLFFLFVIGMVLMRVLTDGNEGFSAIFSGPDPMIGNTLTLYSTLSVIAFLLIQNINLRKYLFKCISVPLLFGGITCLTWIFVGELSGGVLIPTKDGNLITVNWFFLLTGIGSLFLVSIMTSLRVMYYNIDYSINTLSPTSAMNVGALSGAFFNGDEKQQSLTIQLIDRYAGGIRGRKRGLLNLPFGLLENWLSFIYGLHPSFSSMSKDEQRYFLRYYFMRNEWERNESVMPLCAELSYQIGMSLDALMVFSNYSQINERYKVGYIPVDARDRLQGDFASYDPPFNKIADLPKDHTDELNFKPTTGTVTDKIVAPRVTTVVNEPSIPDEVDYLIVGSGAGGATAAYKLACQVGDKSQILVVERGSRYQPLQDFQDSEIEMMKKVYKEGGLQQTKQFTMTVLQGECVGGSTVVNNAVCFPIPTTIKQLWQSSYDIDLSGIQNEYDSIANELSISQLGSKGINQRVRKKFEDGVDKYNMTCSSSEKLIKDFPVLVNHMSTLGDGSWNLGNKRMRKRSMLETYIPWSESRGVKFISNMTAVRFVSTHKGKADRVLLRTDSGQLINVKVRKAVIVAGGTIASSHFLMRSAVDNKNLGKKVSCNFAFPTAFDFQEDLLAFDGDQITLAALDPKMRSAFETYYNPPAAFALSSVPFFFNRRDSVMHRYKNMVNFGNLIGSEPNGSITKKADILNGQSFNWTLGKKDIDNIRYALTTTIRLGMLAGGVRAIVPTKPGIELPLNDNDVNQFITKMNSFPLRMSDLYIGTAHPQGGNLMAGQSSSFKDQRVVNENFQVDGYDNVFVVDASLFPTSITVNPQWTILAMSSLAVKKILKLCP